MRQGQLLDGAASEDGLTFPAPLLLKSGFCEGCFRMKITLEPPLELVMTF